jgi:Rrf2 family protein
MSFANTRFRTAVHALAVIAYVPHELATSDAIAASIATDASVVRRLLSHLRNAGLVQGAQGRSGGYMLARNAGDITLRDVFVALEPEELFPPPERKPNPDCPVGANIHAVLQAPLDAARHGLEDSLASTSLADVIRLVQT